MFEDLFSCQLSFQIIAGLFRISTSAIWENYHRFEERENGVASAQFISKLSGAPNSLLLPEKEENVMAWIGERQRYGDCSSRRDVWDHTVNLFERRTRQERTFTRDCRAIYASVTVGNFW
jgi:hypothetical protein